MQTSTNAHIQPTEKEKNLIIIIDDDPHYSEMLIDMLKRELSTRLEYLLFLNKQDAEDFISDTNKQQRILFCIIDKHLAEGQYDIYFSTLLEKLKIKHIILSSNSQPNLNVINQQEFQQLKKHHHCLNIFSKSSMPYQVVKAVLDSIQHAKQLDKIIKSQQINLALGIIMSKHGLSQKDAAQKINELARQKALSTYLISVQIIDAHNLLTLDHA